RCVRLAVDSPVAGRRKGAPLAQSAKTMGAGVHALGRGIADSMPVLRPAGPMDHRRCAETRSPRSVARIAGEGLKRVRTDKAGRTCRVSCRPRCTACASRLRRMLQPTYASPIGLRHTDVG